MKYKGAITYEKNHLLRMGTAAAMSALIISQGFSAVPSIQTYAEDEEICYYGDLDRDERLSVFDLTLMKRGYANPSTLSDIQREICDVSANGEFDIEDIRLLTVVTFMNGH